jgi:hypothetical protein
VAGVAACDPKTLNKHKENNEKTDRWGGALGANKVLSLKTHPLTYYII